MSAASIPESLLGLPPAKTRKAHGTRRRILDAALSLCTECGYEDATMREIARRAGVATSNAYYYFQSKEHLVQGLYAKTHVEHLEASLPILQRETRLAARLRGVMHAKLETLEPYHPFAGVLFKTAADPASPLNPFGAESAPVRDQSIDLFRELVSGSSDRLPDDLRRDLPLLLWTYSMGVILFWIHDTSAGRERSWKLVDGTVDLILQLVRVSRLPGLGALRRSVGRLLTDVLPDSSPSHRGASHPNGELE